MGGGAGEGGIPVVTLYGREGCHLCEEALKGLIALGSERFRIELREVDIESDPELHRLMLERIPVVEIDGVEVSELVWDSDRTIARLANLEE